MREYQRYVPVLRWRPAEQSALRDLTDDIRERLTPLIELLPSRTPLHGDEARRTYVRGFLQRLIEVWGPERAFLDTQLLRPHFLIAGKSPLNETTMLGRDAGLGVVPVLTLPRQLDDPHVDVFSSPRERREGLCLRLKPLDFELEHSRRVKLISALLRHLRLVPEQVDLIVDEEFTCDCAPDYDRLSTMVPHLESWRSFTIVSGDFPADLQEFDSGLVHSRRRSDWRRWSERVTAGGLQRSPAYGDYTVQYAAYRPPPTDEVPRPSVSVRYTTEDAWLIFRGEAVRDNGPGTEQWNGWAQIIRESPEYKGEAFSAGDRYINERAQDGASSGSFATWISAGINHHVTLTTRQVASLRAA
jgi:hypothetical protein